MEIAEKIAKILVFTLLIASVLYGLLGWKV